jgi:hypothetical protein
MVAEEMFVNCYNFNPIRVKTCINLCKKGTSTQVKKGYIFTPAGAGAGAAIRICGSAEPELEPKEIFSAPQHCLKVVGIFSALPPVEKGREPGPVQLEAHCRENVHLSAQPGRDLQ